MPKFSSIRRGVLMLAMLTACRSPDSVAPSEPAVSNDDAIAKTSDFPPLIETPLPGDPLATTVHRLSNGMTVYISTVRDKPRINALVAVRAGARHDPSHATGLAHYLEHMVLFKGSDEMGTVDHAAETPHLEAIRELYRKLVDAKTPQARKAIFSEIDQHTQAVAKTSIPNEIPSLYDRLGFSGTNAYTNVDRTHYVTELPSNQVKQWAAAESERLRDPVFRLFYPELEAVYEEKNRGMDSAQRRLYEATWSKAFPGHPYGTQTVLGEAAHLKTPAFDEMVGFFDRWYRPNNMAIIVAGDVDASILPLLEETFGKLEAAPLPEPEAATLEGPKGRVEVTVRAPGDSLVRVLWRTVKPTHPDAPALEVIDRLLDDDLVGLLNVAFELSGKAPYAGSYYDFMRESGVTTVEAIVRDDTTHEAIEQALVATVAQLAEGKTTAEQLAAAKLQLTIQETRRFETASARAWRMLQAFTRKEDWSKVAQHAKAIEAVSLDDIARVAKTYFGSDYVVGKLVRGDAALEKIAKPEVTPLTFSEQPHSAMADALEKAKVSPIEPVFLELGKDVVRTPTPRGDLYSTQHDRHDLFDLAFAFDRGMRQQALLCHAMTVWERSGTQTKDARALQVALYQLGAQVIVNCGEDDAFVLLRGVDKNFEAALALLTEWLTRPDFADALREETVKSTLTNRRSILDHDRAITSALRNWVYFGKQSPQRVAPSNDALRRASSKALQAQIAKLLQYKRTTMYYGPRSAEEVVKLIGLGKGERDPGKRYVRRYQPLTETEIHVVHRQSAQANVHILFPGKPMGRDKLGLTATAAAYLHRQAFDELRGARALAYVVRAGMDIGHANDDSALWAMVQPQPDKVLDALPAFLTLLQATRVDGVALDAARGKVREGLRTQRPEPGIVPLVVSEWRHEGLRTDPRAMTWAGVDAVDPAAMQALLEDIAAGPAFITIVGDTSRIELDALAKLGRVQMHEPATLFSFGKFE